MYPTMYSHATLKISQLQIAAVFTIPFDVVKTHRQIEMGEKEIYCGEYQYCSIVDK